MSKLTYEESFFDLDTEEFSEFLKQHPELMPGYAEMEEDGEVYAEIMADYDAVQWAEYARIEKEEMEIGRQEVAALIAEYGEPTLRALLLAIAEDIQLNSRRTVKLFQEEERSSWCALMKEKPIDHILEHCPFGLRMSIEMLPDRVYEVKLGRSSGRAGGGGFWQIQRLGNDFLPAELVCSWYC